MRTIKKMSYVENRSHFSVVNSIERAYNYVRYARDRVLRLCVIA